MVWQYISQRHQTLRTLCSGIGKTAVIYPAVFLAAIAGATVILGMVFFANDVLHATPAQIGYLAGTWAFSYVVGCLFLRPLTARLMPRHSMLLATMLLSLFTAAIFLTRSLVWSFVFYACFGLSLTFFWPPIMGWLSANVEGMALSRAMGWFNLSWSGGALLGPALAGWLSETDPCLALQFAAALYLLTTFLILGAILVLSSFRQDDGAHLQQMVRPSGAPYGTFLRFPGWIGVFALFTLAGVILAVFPISAQQDLHVTKSTVGVILLARALMLSLTLGTMGRRRWWHFRGSQMVIGILISSALALVLAATGNILLAGTLVGLTGVLQAHGYTNALFHGVSGVRHRSMRTALHEALVCGGVIFGSATGGLLYGAFGMATVYLFCATLLVLAALAQLGFLIYARTHGLR